MENNPILSNIRNIYLYLLFWLIVILINFLLLNFLLNFDILISLADSFVFNSILGGLGLSFWYSTRYISFENTGFYKILINHLTGAIVVSALWLFCGYLVMKFVLSLNNNYYSFFTATLPWRFLIGVLLYFVITSFYYLIIYYSGFQERKLHEAELKNLVTQAELKSLKFQINPHFIFNSLNSMSALTTIDPEKARNMILKLAEFLRFTLANNDQQKNKLKEELKNIKLYLEIEKIRFEDKFDFTEELTDECLESEVPNMLLQPLFENAIKHAVYESLEKVKVNLKCSGENGYLKIEVSNTYDPEVKSKKGTGVGLKNISERLKLIYHLDELMKVDNENGTFKVTLFIPQNQPQVS
jgi:two-component system, LytTR family, sensor kinase